MIAFSTRARVDRDEAKWGKFGRKRWLSDCSMYEIQERHEYQGVSVPRHEWFLTLYIDPDSDRITIINRSRNKKAAIRRCEEHARALKFNAKGAK